MKLVDRPAFRLGVSTLILFTGWAGDAWRNLTGWWGFGVVVLIMLTGAILIIVRNRRRLTLNLLPIPLVVFAAMMVLSIAWSYYRLSSVLGVVLTLMTMACGLAVALTLSWPELLRVLGWVFRAILGLSYLFELIVSVFFREPIFPIWMLYGEVPEHPAKLLYWSRDLLFEGGKIQGIVGNSSLLAMAALVALIVFAVQLASRTVSRLGGTFWVLVALGTIAITRSATIFIAFAIVAFVALSVWLVRWAGGGIRGVVARVGIVAVLAVGLIVGFVLRVPLLGLLGKSDDFTGRLGIWDAVIGLAQQRPAFGWGWVGWWAPWASPFDHLIRRGGVQVLHAHNAWLDVWLQLGIAGLIVFAALILSTAVRSWQLATDTDTRISGLRHTAGSPFIAALPLLVLTAQLVQSLAESRILIEGGLMMLVVIAVHTKFVADREPIGRVPA